jgi:hypothetical protein
VGIAAALALGMAALLPGCWKDKRHESPVGYYLDAPALLSSVRSAVFIPLKNETSYPPAADGMTAALVPAIQGKQLFHVEVLPVRDPATEGAVFDGRRPFTLKELAHLRQTLGCDAVLVGAVSQFQAYPRMRIALYLKLLDLRDSRVLWAVEHTWDATDQETQERLEHYFAKEKANEYEPVQWRLGLVSPAVFQQFVAQEAAETLPHRPSAALNQPRGRGNGL